MNSNTNEIIDNAPLFDHGNSLFNFATKDDWKTSNDLGQYANTLAPCTYNDFYEYAKKFLDNRRRKMIKKLIGFKFKKHSKYNLDVKRIKSIEGVIQKRVEKLLNY